jgi:hypothetical protein
MHPVIGDRDQGDVSRQRKYLYVHCTVLKDPDPDLAST